MISQIEALETRRLMAAGTTTLRVDAGGTGYTDKAGQVWLSDRNYTTGFASNNIYDVANTADDPLYYSRRVGNTKYTFPVGNGDYTLRLHFADAVFTTAGSREFNVWSQGKELLHHFDLAANGGGKAALVKSFPLTITNGELDVFFLSVKDNATISAIELVPAAVATPGWSTKAPAPVMRQEGLGTVLNQQLILFGGFDSPALTTTSRADAYNPATNTWKRLADMPEALSHAGVETDGGNLMYVAGGFVGNWQGYRTPVSNRVYVYSSVTNKWTRFVNLPGPRAAGALVRIGRELHFFGGVNSSIADAQQHWVINLDNTALGWRLRADLPDARNHLGYTALNGLIYAIGGQHSLDEDHGNDAAVHVYDPKIDKWKALASLAKPLSHVHNSTFVANGKIVIVGGSIDEHLSVADITQYDPTTNKWTTIGYLPEDRSATVARVINGLLIVTTGTPTGTFPKTTTWTKTWGIFE